MLQGFGALAESRTPDTLIKSQVLYLLSYKGILIQFFINGCPFAPIHNITERTFCQYHFQKKSKFFSGARFLIDAEIRAKEKNILIDENY